MSVSAKSLIDKFVFVFRKRCRLLLLHFVVMMCISTGSSVRKTERSLPSSSSLSGAQSVSGTKRSTKEAYNTDNTVNTRDDTFKPLRTHPKSSPAVPEHIGRRVVAVVRKHDRKQDAKDVKQSADCVLEWSTSLWFTSVIER
jgi:hypothetical protein